MPSLNEWTIAAEDLGLTVAEWRGIFVWRKPVALSGVLDGCEVKVELFGWNNKTTYEAKSEDGGAHPPIYVASRRGRPLSRSEVVTGDPGGSNVFWSNRKHPIGRPLS